MSSVNCRKFPTVFFTSCKSFIDKLYLGTKLRNFKFQNSGQISCALKPYLLMLGHKYNYYQYFWQCNNYSSYTYVVNMHIPITI